MDHLLVLWLQATASARAGPGLKALREKQTPWPESAFARSWTT